MASECSGNDPFSFSALPHSAGFDETNAALAVAAESITIQDLLKAGLHFGHQTRRWNPKMKRYIFGRRNGIHIIDLAQTLAQLRAALEFAEQTVSAGKTILFVGTKKQAQQVIKDVAVSLEQPYVATRWLGGTLTNTATILRGVRRLLDLEEMERSKKLETMNKQMASRLRRERDKLRRNFSGLVTMTETPGAVFVVDVNREANAVREARRMGIPLIALIDTNGAPDGIDYPIPGNDDAIRGISLIAGALACAIRKGRASRLAIAAQEVSKVAATTGTPAATSLEDEAQGKPAGRKRDARTKPSPVTTPAAVSRGTVATEGEMMENEEPIKTHRKSSSKAPLARPGKNRG